MHKCFALHNNVARFLIRSDVVDDSVPDVVVPADALALNE